MSPDENGSYTIIGQTRSDIQAEIDQQPKYTHIIFVNSDHIELDDALIVRTEGLTLSGLKATMPQERRDSKKSLLEITADNVTVEDFSLKGDIKLFEGNCKRFHDLRAPLMAVSGNNFLIQFGDVYESTKDGIMISGESLNGEKKDTDIVGGTIRRIHGWDNGRDVVSIGGQGGPEGLRVRNILVEHIDCENSVFKGAVEVSDGTNNITVKHVTATNCPYAVDIQDHSDPFPSKNEKDNEKKKEEVDIQINSNIHIENVTAIKCEHAIVTHNHPANIEWVNRHTNLSINNITADNCYRPFEIKNTDNVVVKGVTIKGDKTNFKFRKDDKESDSNCPKEKLNDVETERFYISNCNNVKLYDITIDNKEHKGDGLYIEDCDLVDIEKLKVLKSGSSRLSNGISYHIGIEKGKTKKRYSGLRISKVETKNVKKKGILLKSSNNAKLAGYEINENDGSIKDKI